MIELTRTPRSDFDMMFSSGFSEGNAPTSADYGSQAPQGKHADDSDMSSVASDDDPMDYDSMDENEDDEDDVQPASSKSKHPDSAQSGADDGEGDEDADEEGDEQTAHTSILQHEDEEIEEVYVAAESQIEEESMRLDEEEASVPKRAALYTGSPTSGARVPPQLGTSTMRSASTMLNPAGSAANKLPRQSSDLSARSDKAGPSHEASTGENSLSRKRTRSGSDRPGNTGKKYIEVVVTDASQVDLVSMSRIGIADRYFAGTRLTRPCYITCIPTSSSLHPFPRRICMQKILQSCQEPR